MAQTIENIVDPNDSSLSSEMVSFPGQAGTVKAYVSRPKNGTNLGTVLVILLIVYLLGGFPAGRL